MVIIRSGNGHFAAQETRIIIKLFINQARNRRTKFDNQNYIGRFRLFLIDFDLFCRVRPFLSTSTFFVDLDFFCRFRPFLTKKNEKFYDNRGFLGYKWNISVRTEKLAYYQICAIIACSSYKKRRLPFRFLALVELLSQVLAHFLVLVLARPPLLAQLVLLVRLRVRHRLYQPARVRFFPVRHVVPVRGSVLFRALLRVLVREREMVRFWRVAWFRIVNWVFCKIWLKFFQKL